MKMQKYLLISLVITKEVRNFGVTSLSYEIELYKWGHTSSY